MERRELSFVVALAWGLLGINAAQATVITLDFETAGTGRNLPTVPLTTSVGTISASVSGGTLVTHDISANTKMSGQSLEHQQDREPDYAQLAFDFDVSSITFLYAGNVLGQFLAQVLDASLGVLDAYYDADTEFDLPGGPVTLSGVGIRYFRFLDPDFYYGWAVIDDVAITAAVPEPATLALFGLGLAGLGAMRRKKLAASPSRLAATVLLTTLVAVPMVGSAATVWTTDFIADSSRSGFNGFESVPTDSSNRFFAGSFPYVEGGIAVSQVNGEGSSDIYVTCVGCFGEGFDGSYAWYPNGGDFGYTRIARSDGSDFDSIGMVTGSGFSFSLPIVQFYQLFDGGTLVMSGSLPGSPSGRGYLGFSGGGFDEIRVYDRLANEGTQNAFAVDSIEIAGASVPEPAILALFGLGLAGIGAVRRKKLAA